MTIGKLRWMTMLCLCTAAACTANVGEEPNAQVSEAVAPLWTGTWAASPQSSGTAFNQKTLRQIVHTSISGTSARIQLSNAFGSQPVQISDVHLARRSSGSSVDASSDRPVTFGGQTSVTIPVGGVAISDSVAFAVSALSDVAVSFYLPQNTPNATSHGQGTQTNYVANGDVSGNATLSGASTTGSYYFLANVDVQNTASLGAVVGVATIAVGRRDWSAKIPFGPYLALGALTWLFVGPELVAWYWAWTLGGV